MAAAAVQHILSTGDIGPLKNTQVNQSLSVASKPATKRNVQADLHYHKDNEDGSPPHPTYVDKPETYERPFETHSVKINDITGDEDKFTLDRNGFQIYQHQTIEKNFVDDAQIKASYYPETEQLLKTVAASRDRAARGPVQRVHIDQSYKAALSRVPYHLPADAEELLKGRVQIINVWRPIKTVQRDPLAVAEAGSVSDEDLVVTDLIYPNRRGETYAVRHKDGHQWYYKAGLSPDEVILIKCFDSKTDGRARRVPHTSFVDPSASQDVPPRESIEVRALVFHPEDQK
ncbi:hydroxylase/desaturase asaB [Colletotrichum liriopes]|uniref:Hydroxylase/desaturase asaB n=1 Tax=Colletotrichum liriopes TaxID=708192 RepID=A0AA37H2Z5_9PEZI|nr:hydroxylase/desaturase asaB [Colletotrichum liriopes]